MPINTLKSFLDQNNVPYVTIRHSIAYTARETAASAHIPRKGVAKTVILKIDGKLAMAVLPASHQLDTALLKKAIGAHSVEIAGESEFKDMFPECDIGAMPPFGNLYGLEVIAEGLLAENESIAFNACSHTELIQLSYNDFIKTVKPKIAAFSKID